MAKKQKKAKPKAKNKSFEDSLVDESGGLFLVGLIFIIAGMVAFSLLFNLFPLRVTLITLAFIVLLEIGYWYRVFKEVDRKKYNSMDFGNVFAMKTEMAFIIPFFTFIAIFVGLLIYIFIKETIKNFKIISYRAGPPIIIILVVISLFWMNYQLTKKYIKK